MEGYVWLTRLEGKNVYMYLRVYRRGCDMFCEMCVTLHAQSMCILLILTYVVSQFVRTRIVAALVSYHMYVCTYVQCTFTYVWLFSAFCDL